MSDLLNEHYERDKKIRAYLNRNKEIEKQILDRAKRWEDASKENLAMTETIEWQNDLDMFLESNPSYFEYFLLQDNKSNVMTKEEYDRYLRYKFMDKRQKKFQEEQKYELKQFINDQNNAMLKQGKAIEAILSQLEQGNSDGKLRCNDYLSARHNDMLFLRMEVEERNNILKEILGKLEGTQ